MRGDVPTLGLTHRLRPTPTRAHGPLTPLTPARIQVPAEDTRPTPAHIQVPAEEDRPTHLIQVLHIQIPAEGGRPTHLLPRIRIHVAEASPNPPGLDDGVLGTTAWLIPILTAVCLVGMVTPVRAMLRASMEEGCP